MMNLIIIIGDSIMTPEQKLIKENLERVDLIFDIIDFGKVALSNEHIIAMNDFYTKSKRYLDDNNIKYKLSKE